MFYQVNLSMYTVFQLYIIFYVMLPVNSGIFFSSGLAFGIVGSSGHLALNSYFKEKRGIATGINWTIIGLGPVLVPHLVNALLNEYGVDGTTLIFGGISLNAIVGTLLLQPVEWHMKKKPASVAEEDDNMSVKKLEPVPEVNTRISIDTSGQDNDESGKPLLTRTTDQKLELNTNKQVENKVNERQGSYKRQNSLRRSSNLTNNIWNSINSLNSAASMCEATVHVDQEALDLAYNSEKNEDSAPKKSSCEKIIASIVSIFDLDLLKDPIYVTIIVGMCFSYFSEGNFALLTPLVLVDYGWTKGQAAIFMSSIGIADLAMRFVAPFISDRYKLTPRPLYMAGIIGMVLGRTGEYFVRNGVHLL